MSNYTITTDFGAKDSLPSGNAAKVIKGSEFTTEFTNIKTAVNSKADLVSPTFTGNTALNGTTTFGPDGTSTFNGTVNFTKDVTFDTNTMFVDVSENRVGIGNVAPATALDVTGTVTASGLTVDTTTLHVDATNNRVGIGTTSPTQNLHVYHATDNQIATFESGDSTSALKIKDSVDETLIQNLGGVQQFVSNNTGAGTSGTRFLHGGSDVMRIASSGNVGIGTSNPSSQLHVSSTDVVSITQTHTDGNTVSLKQSGTGGDVEWRNGNGEALILTNSQTRMTVDSSGNVGIGITSPAESLHTAGNIRLGDTAPAEIYTNSNELRLGVDRNNDNDASNITFYTNNNEKVRIEKDGNVGIGTTNPSRVLHVKGSNDTVRLESTGSNTKIEMVNTGSTTNEFGFKSNNFFVAHGGTERMRIDSAGNVLVGKTATGFGTAGIELFHDNQVYATSTTHGLAVNRLSTDGAIAKFYRDSATVGSIGTTYQSGVRYMHIAGASTGIGFYSGGIFPCDSSGTFANNSKDLGSSTVKWDDVYATNGTIQTSDRNEKQDIAELSDAEQRVAVACKGLLRKFRWRYAVEEKGDEARIHFGIIAQDLQDAFTAEGLDAGDYAMFINSTWTDEETGEERSSMGVRYSELLAFIISAI